MGEIGYPYRMSAPGTMQHSSHGTPRASSIDLARVRSMLEALDHTHLIDLITDLVSKQPSVYDHLRSNLRSDPTQCRLFVRGLSRECTNQDLMAVFSVYGQVDEAVVMKEKGTQCCKGFGFVTFADAEAADAAIKNPEKLITGRMAIVSLAALGNKNKSAAPVAGIYSPTSSNVSHSSAITGCYSQPPSSTSHKRYREDSSGPSISYYDSYKPPSSRYPRADSQYRSQQSYELQNGDPHMYRRRESAYSDHTTSYSTQNYY